MTKLIIAIVIVATILVGGLMKLLKSRNQSMGSPEVLARVKKREQELEAQEKREDEDR